MRVRAEHISEICDHRCTAHWRTVLSRRRQHERRSLGPWRARRLGPPPPDVQPAQFAPGRACISACRAGPRAWARSASRRHLDAPSCQNTGRIVHPSPDRLSARDRRSGHLSAGAPSGSGVDPFISYSLILRMGAKALGTRATEIAILNRNLHAANGRQISRCWPATQKAASPRMQSSILRAVSKLARHLRR